MTSFRASFKFLVDRPVFESQNSKNATRESAGKFITVYPSDDRQFYDLLEALCPALAEHTGPFILSDRRYKDSRVVYYRYGAIAPRPSVDSEGTRKHLLKAPDGSEVEDQRRPFFALPPWVIDHLHRESEDRSEGLKDGRYQVERVLGFSGFGGVYLARDLKVGDDVVIKEARPHGSAAAAGLDAVGLLRKEHRLLGLVARDGIAPKPRDLFQDWEHSFLVEEFIRGESLKIVENRRTLFLRRAVSSEDVNEYLIEFVALYGTIARHLATLHEHHVVFGDISNQNVLVARNKREAWFIDFEGAFEVGVDPTARIFTPGFARADRKADGLPSYRGDLFGLGALMLAALMPVNRLFGLDHNGIVRVVTTLVSDLRLPRALRDLVCALMDYSNPEVVSARQVAGAIEALPVHSTEWPAGGKVSRWDRRDVGRVYQHILGSATPERSDRLFPADPHVFSTNGVNIAYGAAGVALSLYYSCRHVPAFVLDWIEAQDPVMWPPGLFVGVAGLSWLYAAMGNVSRAGELAERAYSGVASCDSCDLFSGKAGVGMAQLKLFGITKEAKYLRRAEAIGQSIVGAAVTSEADTWWAGPRGRYYGLAHGAAGTSLFLLYLAIASAKGRFLDLGCAALKAEMAKSQTTFGGAITWTMHEDSMTQVPYWRYGSAGVSEALIRFFSVTGDVGYLDCLGLALQDVSRRYSVHPGRFFGLSGLGDCLLDVAEFSEDGTSARRAAEEVADAVTLFAIERGPGVAFPGESLLRLSCDFGTGSAGVALFLRRLAEGGSSVMMLDELLDAGGKRLIPSAWTSSQELAPSPLWRKRAAPGSDPSPAPRVANAEGLQVTRHGD